MSKLWYVFDPDEWTKISLNTLNCEYLIPDSEDLNAEPIVLQDSSPQQMSYNDTMNNSNNPAVATGYSRGAAQVSGNQLP